MKINNFEKFVESVSNLAKVRKWDTYDVSVRRKKDQRQVSDLYFTYNLKKDELGKYLNTWFTGVVMKSKDGKTYRDEMITLKKVDKETAAEEKEGVKASEHSDVDGEDGDVDVAAKAAPAGTKKRRTIAQKK